VDVEISSTRSQRYSASSTDRVSRPATSESEGLRDQYPLEDEDGDEDDNDDKLNASITVPQLSKKENVSAGKKKRDDALNSEVWVLF
jgi:hypothetical protein